MADQRLRTDIGEFSLDLHGTAIDTARSIIRVRIMECFKYGIQVLKLVYGTPDDFQHSIAKAAHEVIRGSELVVHEMSPAQVWDDSPNGQISPSIRIYLRPNPNPKPLDGNTEFSPFIPKYEKDIERRLRCRIPFRPMARDFDIAWACRGIGHGCTVGQAKELLRPATERITYPQLIQLGRWVMSTRSRDKTRKKKRDEGVSPRGPAFAVDIRPQSQAQQVDATGGLNVYSFEDVFKRASSFELSSQYEEAVTTLEEALARDSLSNEQRTDSHLVLGRCYFALGNAKAEGHLRHAVAAFEADGKSSGCLEAVRALAAWYLKSGEYEEYLKNIQKLATDVREATWTDYVLHSRVLYSAGRYDESLDCLQWLSCQIGEGEIGSALDVWRMDTAGLDYLEKGDMQLAAMAFAVAKRVCVKSNNECSEMLPMVLMHQGRVARKEGRLEEALSQYDECLSLLRRQGRLEERLAADIYTSKGVAHRHHGNALLAVQCHERAAQVYVRLEAQETPEYAKIMINLGASLGDKGDFERAEDAFDSAESLLQLKVDRHYPLMVTLLHRRAHLRARKGDSELGRITFEDAIEMAERRLPADSPITPFVRKDFGEWLCRWNDISAAIHQYELALPVLQQMNPTVAHDLKQKVNSLRETH